MGGIHCKILGCLVAVFLMGHSGVAEQLLASWEEGTTTPSHTPVAGVDASLGLTSAADTYAAGSIDGTFESVTNEIPTAGKTNEFIRLKIIQN